MIKDSKMVAILGAPSSGKSTLATSVHHGLKISKRNSIFVGEAATDYIAEWGIPDTPTDQIIIFYKQLGRERMYVGSKEFIICDSSSILNYFYFRSLFSTKLSLKDIATINHLQKEILKSLNQWHKIYYVPPFLEEDDQNDGIRYHNKEEIIKLDLMIKNYLDLERIQYTDLSNIPIRERDQWVLADLTKSSR
jgi:ABC-type dipeptide/oligopeptide/nickel transport system ATPase component